MQQPAIFWDRSTLETNWQLLKGQYSKQVMVMIGMIVLPSIDIDAYYLCDT